jgi:hypothetical protein
MEGKKLTQVSDVSPDGGIVTLFYSGKLSKFLLSTK